MLNTYHKIKNALLNSLPFFRRKKNPLHFILTGFDTTETPFLLNQIDKHPNIALASNPNCHFFDQKTDLFQALDTDAYNRLFQLNKRTTVFGDLTPSYFYWQTAPRRIYEYNPKTKIIVLLQNPIERAYSHWEKNKSIHIEPLSFEDALNAEKERTGPCLPFQDIQFGYKQMGYYSESIRRYQRYFKNHNLLFITYNDLADKPQDTLNKIAAFLEINPFVLNRSIAFNSRTSSINLETYQELLEGYYFDIKESERLLQQNLLAWLQVPSK